MRRSRSIRTRYKGILFRSKLEADWARFFDSIALPWRYEEEGRYFGDVFYLPDFYLPASRQWVEVKGDWQPDDVRRIGALLAHVEARPHCGEEVGVPDLTLVCCGTWGQFWGYVRGETPDFATILLEKNRYTLLARCRPCGGWWFADQVEGLRCQCCGFDDGHRHLSDLLFSPIDPWPVRQVA